jgi:hypothetical protein
VLCVKRLYSGSVLLVTRRGILQFMYMLGHYQYLCLVEEFQKPKDVLYASPLALKRRRVVLMDVMIMLQYISVYLGHVSRLAFLTDIFPYSEC